MHRLRRRLYIVVKFTNRSRIEFSWELEIFCAKHTYFICNKILMSSICIAMHVVAKIDSGPVNKKTEFIKIWIAISNHTFRFCHFLSKDLTYIQFVRSYDEVTDLIRKYILMFSSSTTILAFYSVMSKLQF